MIDRLIALLHRRVAIIEDHAWREQDAAGHLAALKDVSEEIQTWTNEHGPSVDARLRHYLGNCSFQKALIHLQAPPSS